jgi:hypothetical protein
MRREISHRLVGAALLVLLGGAARTTHAQPMMGGAPAGGGMPGGGRMPDLRVMNGKPLPDPGLAPGTVTVRVARKMPVNAVSDVEVIAIIKNPGGDLKKRTVKTDASGRASFEGVGAGHRFSAEVTVDGERIKTSEFEMPAQGGVRTMLIAGIGPAPAEGSNAEEGGDGDGPGGGGQDDFSIGASTGTAAPAPELPAKTLEVRVFDEERHPIPGQAVLLGVVGQGDGKLKVLRATADAQGVARFEELGAGPGIGYAAVADYRGIRLGTQPFTMPATGGARAEIHAMTRTSDPSVIAMGGGGRVILQMHEEVLQILEMLPIENRSDKLFDPGVGGIEIPLPKGFVSAEPVEGGTRKLEVRSNHGIAVRGPVTPKSTLGGEADSAKAAGNEVSFAFALPFHGSSHRFEQPMPNGLGPTALITEQLAGLVIEGAGIGQPQSRELNGRKYWVMPMEAIAPGQSLSFVVKGLPSADNGGRVIAGVLALLLVAAALIFGRRPAGTRKVTAGERDKLLERRETLFSDLVNAERDRRREAGGAAGRQGQGQGNERRGQLIAKLESIYRDLAALDEQRAP